MPSAPELIPLRRDSATDRLSYPPTSLASVATDPFQDDSSSSSPSATPRPSMSEHGVFVDRPRYALSDRGSIGTMYSEMSVDTMADDKEWDDRGRPAREDEYAPLKGGARDRFRTGNRESRGSSLGNEPITRAGTLDEGNPSMSTAWDLRQQLNPRRALTRKVKLNRGGIFVTEYPVPTAVKNANTSGGYSGGPTEFTHMRYTAACCDPDDFTTDNGYTLRASTYGRETDLLICVTAYNENKFLLARTLHGLMLNIRDMVKGKFSEFRRNTERGGTEGGIEGWKKIVVTLVFDGVVPADKEALDVLATVGLFQDGVMKKDVDGKDTIAHIFEYTTQLSMSSEPALVEPSIDDPNNLNLVPVQMILVLKHKNAKKINSHRWLFNAIGRHLNPGIVCLLDAGTKPGKRSIYYLWEAFHHNRYLGGACGEIHAMLGRGGRKLINPLVAAQNFEYKISNILDKPTESAFGYVSVLPGAFSCYRYTAVQGRPLEQYFHGDGTLAARLGPKGTDGMGIWRKNMFLAEDRILCSELVSKAGERWVLGFVKLAKGETDVPETAAELIGQRRRWLNGSFAAQVYALVHLPRLYRSGHGITRIFFLHIQAIYSTANLIMSWFAVANYYITFSIIIQIVQTSLRSPLDIPGASAATIQCWSGSFIQDDSGLSVNWLEQVNWILNIFYLAFLLLQVVLALGSRPKAEKVLYTTSISAYAFLSAYLILNTLILTVKAFCPITSDLAASGGNPLRIFLGGTFGPIFAGIAGTFGVVIVSSIIVLDPVHLITSMPAFLVIAPSFTNILNVYAFCNLHDVSWGTKGSDTVELPSATSKQIGKAVVVEVQQNPQGDIDAAFKATVLRAVSAFDHGQVTEDLSPEDENRSFRNRFILLWFASNGILALAIARLSGMVPTTSTTYFTTILWINFSFAVFRFLGLLYYLLSETGFRIARLFGRCFGRGR